MKWIILAAGKWERLMPLTQTKPKPMVKVFGKSLLEHVLDGIAPFVDEIMIVVRYYKEAIMEGIWQEFKWIPINYVIQWDKKGTAAALRDVEAKDDVLILNGDTIYDQQDIKNLVETPDYGILAKEVDNPSLYGVFEIDSNWIIQRVVEKSPNPPSNLANIGAYKLPAEILKYAREVSLSPRWEYELTDALNELFSKYTIKAIPLTWEFLDIGYPWHILRANAYFFSKYKPGIYWEGEIEEWVQIYPDAIVILSPGSVIKKWAIINGNLFLGENAIVGPNSFVRWNVVIWNNSLIGFSVETKNISAGDNTKIPHLSYVWDSILGDNVNVAWWTIIANLRHDGKNISYLVKWELVDTGLRKFWCVIWDNAKLGIWTRIYPWRQIGANQTTLPWEIVR